MGQEPVPLKPDGPPMAMTDQHNSNRVKSHFLEVLTGSAAGLIGLGLLMPFVFLVHEAFVQSLRETSVIILFVIMTGLGVFLLLVSYRLLTKSGAYSGAYDGGGLLSPTGWMVMGGIFSVQTVIFASDTAWQSGDLILLLLMFSSTLLAGLCFLMAIRSAKKIRWNVELGRTKRE